MTCGWSADFRLSGDLGITGIFLHAIGRLTTEEVFNGRAWPDKISGAGSGYQIWMLDMFIVIRNKWRR